MDRSGQQAKVEYRKASRLDPGGLIGKVARSVLAGSGLMLSLIRTRGIAKSPKEMPRAGRTGGDEHNHLARRPG